MRRLEWIMLLLVATASRAHGQAGNQLPPITQDQDYTWHLSSSSDPTGGNIDFRTISPGQTLTVLDEDGPGMVSHMWFTIASLEPYSLKRIVLRIYWDGEETPSVETPIGDFFGLGLGEYYIWNSAMLSVGGDGRALNCFFPMPYQRHARITVTNEGKMPVTKFYFNIDYRKDTHPLPPKTLYFHAQYRQAQPNHGLLTSQSNGKNLDGKDNYVWLEARGHGHFVGLTMSVLQNQDGWWGEGDPMFFIDDPDKPQLPGGTGAEDYFLSAWGFGSSGYSNSSFGAPVISKPFAGGRWSVYRFHTDSPIPFTKYMKATIEHGNANDRSDNYYSVAYWYQAEPHMPFPPLPAVEDRIPTLQLVSGPVNPGAAQPNTGAAQPNIGAPQPNTVLSPK
jgi:hypothetical protein